MTLDGLAQGYVEQRLIDAARAHTTATYEATEREAERDVAIRDAHRAGMTTRAIAAIVGVSHQRVGQIVKP